MSSRVSAIRAGEEFPDRVVLRINGYNSPDNAAIDEAAKEFLQSKTTRKRAVIRIWPRDPNGKAIKPGEDLPGKATSNGLIWSASLYGLYQVRRWPTLGNVMATLSGSMLTAWMEAHDELQWAAGDILLAKNEASPRETPPFNIAQLIEDAEVRVVRGMWGKSVKMEEEKQRKEELGVLTSLFDAPFVPAPWPFVPFVRPGEAPPDNFEEILDEAEQMWKRCALQFEGGENENGDEGEGAEPTPSADENENEDENEVENEGEVAEMMTSEDENEEKSEGGAAAAISLDDKDENENSNETGDENKNKGKAAESASIFDTSVYPAPWPLAPFSYPAPVLQDYIPLHKLPKKLIVHDPCNLLNVNAGNSYDSESDGPPVKESQETKGGHDWIKGLDVTHVYKLQLSTEGEKRLEEELKQAAKERAEAEAEEPGPGFLIQPSQEILGPIEPPIYIVYPPAVPPVIEEAHLYLSPDHFAGEGNHSVLYKAEWEVPRSMLMPDQICRDCISEDLEDILIEEDGEDGERKDPRWKEKSATVKKVRNTYPAVKIGVLDKSNSNPQSEDTRPYDDGVYTISEGDHFDTINFEGPVRPIRTRVPWRSLEEQCPHSEIPYLATTKVSVIAKLSIQFDPHLENEARNYQAFPKHLFEHWNGFNIVPSLNDPVPVGAVVPQFYGYYVPENADMGKDPDNENSGYLSPILLMENCGDQLNPDGLSVDEKHECMSLYYRFHHAGWMHGSTAERNILGQKGPLSAPPGERDKAGSDEDQKYSFRLIDFGRSCNIGYKQAHFEEDRRVRTLFDYQF